jgi:hypothetical protein
LIEEITLGLQQKGKIEKEHILLAEISFTAKFFFIFNNSNFRFFGLLIFWPFTAAKS